MPLFLNKETSKRNTKHIDNKKKICNWSLFRIAELKLYAKYAKKNIKTKMP